ncbi:MAG TPA: HAD-IIIA family hydrolase [Desulfobacteraceae bacterium]|nr:HAD-IIIA family hydrolase [Desulfobacteraceae bacterium]
MNLDKLKHIRLLLLDADGVLTDGGIIYNDNGLETKCFNVKDGLGIRLLMEAGIKVGIVTGRHSEALSHRCRNLGITHVFEGVRDKAAVLDLILDKTEISANEIAFVGDDLLDISIMKLVSVSIAVADAHETVIKHSDIVTQKKGGDGAVREVCEAILKSQGLWEKFLKRFCEPVRE